MSVLDSKEHWPVNNFFLTSSPLWINDLIRRRLYSEVILSLHDNAHSNFVPLQKFVQEESQKLSKNVSLIR